MALTDVCAVSDWPARLAWPAPPDSGFSHLPRLQLQLILLT